MKESNILAITSLCALLATGLLGCGQEEEADPFAEECAFACEGFSEREGEITTGFPIYFDVDTCVEEFCTPKDTLVDPPGRGSEACDTSLWAYLDCINGMTCEDWDDSDIVSVFSGAGAAGCDDESSDFVLDCLARLPR